MHCQCPVSLVLSLPDFQTKSHQQHAKRSPILVSLCEQIVSGAENGAERAENRLERSGSGRSSERERAKSSAQNPLHRKTKINFKSYITNCKCKFISLLLFCCVENNSDYLALCRVMVSVCCVGTRNSYAQPGPCKIL